MNRLGLTSALAVCLLLVHAMPGQELQWQSDVDIAKNLAANNGKLVLLHFTADWCRPCKQLKTFVFPSPNVVSAIENRCVPVLIDTDANPELVKQYDVESIPMDVVITPQGRVLQKRKSPKDATNFVRMIKAVDNADTQYAQRNAVISRKIGDVLDEIQAGGTSKLSNDNDFSVQRPEANMPETGKDGKLLLAKSKNRLVEHVADVEPAANQMADSATNQFVSSQGPQRVINDRFFAAKTHPKQTAQASATIQAREAKPEPGKALAPSSGVNQFVSTAANAMSKTEQELQQAREQMGIPTGGEFVPVNSRSGAFQSEQTLVQSETKKSTAKTSPAETVPAQATSPREAAATAVVKSSNRSESRARLIKKVEEVPGKIEVNAVRENLATATKGQSAKVAADVSAKIVATDPAKENRNNALRENLLRSRDVSIPDLVRGTTDIDVRDSVQKMFDGSPRPNVSKPPQPPSRMGLGGKCPVTLVEDGQWVMGDKQFGCVHRGRTYLFGDAQKLIQFQRAPEKYSPILAGFDPVVFHNQGELVEGEEKHGVFMGQAPAQRIVLFQSQASRDEFQKNPKKYMATVRLAIKQSDAMR